MTSIKSVGAAYGSQKRNLGVTNTPSTRGEGEAPSRRASTRPREPIERLTMHGHSDADKDGDKMKD